MSLAQTRIATERKSWRKDHPFGFVAKPRTNPDGSVDLFTWNCLVPGKKGSIWEGGRYPVTIKFGSQYPTVAPEVSFPVGFLHPNVFEGGQVCLSIIGSAWRPSISVKEILLGLQELLDKPNELDPANWNVNHMFLKRFEEYEAVVKEQVKKYAEKVDD